MDPATIENIGNLSSLASQYGPFFFSILFILFIPVLGQKWFFRVLQTKAAGHSGERAIAIQVYKFYWISGIVAGLVLVGFSVFWWAFIRYNIIEYQYRISEEHIQHEISQELHRRIFQGVIRGADDNDIFVYDFNNPQYSIYMFPQRNQRPMLVRYVVVFTGEPTKDEKIRILYMNRQSYDLLSRDAVAVGYKPTPLEFCITNAAADMTFVKDESSPPHFNISCEKQSP